MLLGQRPNGPLVLTFFECDPLTLCQGLQEWGNRQDRLNYQPLSDWRTVWTEFSPGGTFQIVAAASDQWSLHSDNAMTLTTGLAYTMARRLRTRGVRFISSHGSDFPYPCLTMEYHDGTRESQPVDRKVGVSYDTRPYFLSEGEPLPFEETDAYRSRKIADRMTYDRLAGYARSLGVTLEISQPLHPCYLLVDRLIVGQGSSSLAAKLASATSWAAQIPGVKSATVITADDAGEVIKRQIR